ncbi:MAG: ATP-binding protein [Bacteroidales bacterium]|nr:ATP-binding protein [Bacteroidales bacterium]
MILREQYIKQLEPFIGKPIIKVITGIRRSGKSTFLKMICNTLTETGVDQRNLILINKDSLEFDFIKDYHDLDNYVKNRCKKISGKIYLFIDEVQEIDGWEKAVSGFLADQTADLFITGSNSRILSSELATYISGRYVEFTMYTLTFSEFLKFRQVTAPAQRESEFGLFMKYGGFPGIHRMEYDDEVVAQYIGSLYNTILLKDVVARNGLRDVALLEKVARFMADNCGNITSSKKIADFLKSQKIKGSVDTIHNYLTMLVSAYLFHQANRFDIKGKRLLEIHEKYYTGDIGLNNTLVGYKFQDISGRLENIVYLELLYRRYTVHIGKLNELEIDFIASKNDERIYIQVAYLLHDQKTIDREFGALEKIPDNYPKMVLSMDKHHDSNRKGIQWFNLIEFLVGQ